jgi:hypothetical protein
VDQEKFCVCGWVRGSRADLCHVADEVWDCRQRPAPDVHVRVHPQVLVPHLDLGEVDVHPAVSVF